MNKLEELIETPARSLVREFLIPGFWEKNKSNLEKLKLDKIKEWVERADSDDKIAQAVLLRAQELLDEKKVGMTTLPMSLKWEPSADLPK